MKIQRKISKFLVSTITIPLIFSYNYTLAQFSNEQSAAEHSAGQTILLKSDSIATRFLKYQATYGERPSADKQMQWQREISDEQAQIIAQLPQNFRISAQLSRAINAIKVVSDDALEYASLDQSLVKSISETQVHTLDLANSVPLTGATALHQYGITGQGVRIGILDSGVDYMHVNLGGSGEGYEINDPNIVEPGTFPNEVVVGGVDLVGDNYNPRSEVLEERVPQPDGDPINFDGDHGTHVAAIAAGRAVDGVGGGVAPEAKIYAIKIGQAGSRSIYSAVAEEAMEYVLDPNGDFDISDRLDVINMSFGRSFGSIETPYALAVKAVLDMGVIVVGSAGNGGPTPYITSSPGSTPGVISVAATENGADGQASKIARFSSQGPFHGEFKPSIAAPGVRISAADAITGNGLTSKSGTSMSAPHVAGAMALLKSAHPNFSVAELKAVLMNNAKLLDDSDGEKYPLSLQGMGEIDIEASLNADYTAMPAGINFGLMSLDEFTQRKATLTVSNQSHTAQMIEISVAEITALPGVKLTHPKRIWMGANAQRDITVKLHFNPFVMQSLYESAFYEYGAVLEFTPTLSGKRFRVGFQAVVKPVTDIDIERGADNTTRLYNNSKVPALVSALKQRDVTDTGNTLPVHAIASQVIETDTGKIMRLGLVANAAIPSGEEFYFSSFWDIDGDRRTDYTVRLARIREGYMLQVRNPQREIIFSKAVTRDFDSKIATFEFPLPAEITSDSAAVRYFSREHLSGVGRGQVVLPLVPDNESQLPWLDTLAPWKNAEFARSESERIVWFIHNADANEQAIIEN